MVNTLSGPDHCHVSPSSVTCRLSPVDHQSVTSHHADVSKRLLTNEAKKRVFASLGRLPGSFCTNRRFTCAGHRWATFPEIFQRDAKRVSVACCTLRIFLPRLAVFEQKLPIEEGDKIPEPIINFFPIFCTRFCSSHR